MNSTTHNLEAASHLMDWLRDAHAMEEQAESMLEGMAGRLESYPDLRQRIRQHIEETRDQKRLIKECIERRGGDTSMVKDLTGKAMASMQAFSGMLTSDEVIKGGMFSYAFEHMEIAAYRNLIEAARLLGDTATQQVCERILPQEVAMAAWLEQNMAAVTRRFLERAEQPGAHAKR